MRRPILFVLLLFIVLAPAAATERSPDDLAWRSVGTEHFTFIYRPQHQAAVDELVGFAEEVYEEVTGLFESYPEHIDAVVFGETDLANGYYTSAPPQHIGLFVPQPTMPFIDTGAESWLRLLLTHEVTHLVQANYRPGLFDVIGTVFGRSLTGFSMAFAPLWLSEGIAVNAETVLTDGGRGRNPFFEMQYKAPAVEERFWSLSQSGYDSHLAPVGRYYVAGYFIWDYLMREYGPELTARFMRNFSGFPLFGVWWPMESTTGKSMGEIYDEATAELVRRYADDATLEAARRLSPDRRGDYHLPRVTDRGLYLYRSRPDRTPAIVVFDPDTGDERVVLEMRLTDPASWAVTADGSTIVFASPEVDDTFPDERSIRSNLFRYDVDTRTVSPITSEGGFHQPAVSPDGSTMVAVRRDGRFQQLVRRDLDATPEPGHSEWQTLYAADELRLYTPSFSPDRSTLAVVANQRGTQHLLLLGLRDDTIRHLATPRGGRPYFPTFADDDTLLYGHDGGGSLTLYRYSVSSETTKIVATDPVGAFAGVAHGDDLVIASYTSDGYTLRTQPDTARSPASGDPVPALEPAEGFASLDPPTPVQGTPWTPLPAPRFWFPSVGIAGPDLEPAGLGAGALVYGADLLNRHVWQLQSIYYPALTQLDYSARWTTRYARLGFSAAAASQYAVYQLGVEQAHTKVFQHGAQLSYALLARHRLGVSHRVSTSVSATHTLLYVSDGAFALQNMVGPAESLALDAVSVTGGLSASRTPLASRQAYHAPGALSGTVGLTTSLPAPSYAPTAGRGELVGRVNLGIGGSDHVLALLPAVNLASGAAFARAFDLRGFGATTDHTASEGLPGRYRLSLDYHTPHWLMDVPLVPGLGITGTGLTLYAQATGGYDLQPARFALDDEVGVGAEVTVMVNFWQNIPITFGVQTRVRPADLARYAPFADTTVYVNSDFLSTIPRLPQYLDPGL